MREARAEGRGLAEKASQGPVLSAQWIFFFSIFTYLAASGPSCGACGIFVWWVGFSLAEAHGLSSCGTRA